MELLTPGCHNLLGLGTSLRFQKTTKMCDASLRMCEVDLKICDSSVTRCDLGLNKFGN